MAKKKPRPLEPMHQDLDVQVAMLHLLDAAKDLSKAVSMDSPVYLVRAQRSTETARELVKRAAMRRKE